MCLCASVVQTFLLLPASSPPCDLPLSAQHLVAIEFAVADGGAVAAGGEPGAQFFGDVDRAVTSARAAEGDGEVALALGAIARQQRLEEARQPREEAGLVGVALHIGAHLWVLAGLVAERVDIMGVAQE